MSWSLPVPALNHRWMADEDPSQSKGRSSLSVGRTPSGGPQPPIAARGKSQWCTDTQQRHTSTATLCNFRSLSIVQTNRKLTGPLFWILGGGPGPNVSLLSVPRLPPALCFCSFPFPDAVLVSEPVCDSSGSSSAPHSVHFAFSTSSVLCSSVLTPKSSSSPHF